MFESLVQKVARLARKMLMNPFNLPVRKRFLNYLKIPKSLHFDTITIQYKPLLPSRYCAFKNP